VVRILATLLRPDAGTARVGGFDVARQPDKVRPLLGLTGHENLLLIARLLELPRRDARRRADELLERFDLADAGGRPVRTYSGGMRRRLDLAASLVCRPPVLFLDEPTTGLDPRARGEARQEPSQRPRPGLLLIFPLTFGSNVFVPTAQLPGWLQAWVTVNPVTQVSDAARGLLLDLPLGASLTTSLLWTAAILVVFAPLAVRAYRRQL
jgi:ABC transporter